MRRDILCCAALEAISLEYVDDTHPELGGFPMAVWLPRRSDEAVCAPGKLGGCSLNIPSIN